MSYLFTSESVSEGHPDKIADQISDSILDAFLSQDPESKVACETLVTTGLAIISGEVRSLAYVDVQKVVRETIERIGYTKSQYKFDYESCGVMSSIHEQSPDIAQGVDVGKTGNDIGAGDQGMMFGYATNESDNYMPLPIHLSHTILKQLAELRREADRMPYLAPDSKSQVTLRYNSRNAPDVIDTIVVSTQHDEFADDLTMAKQIRKDVQEILLPRVRERLSPQLGRIFEHDFKLFVNPTGKFVIGGPHGDTGLTGRKIIVDTYGGRGAHGGGAFSGKDATKVDRSAAYAMRHIAKNLVASGISDEALVQVAYAIGVSQPVGLFVHTYGTCRIKGMTDGEIANKLREMLDLRPAVIINRYGLRNPIFAETAAYGHMGRTPGKKQVQIGMNGAVEQKDVETFLWEKLDLVDSFQETFNL
jgi:S-adenosylmethionine synthetase